MVIAISLSKAGALQYRGMVMLPKPYVADDGGFSIIIKTSGGVVPAVCRELLFLGIPDQPFRAFWQPNSTALDGPSIYQAALKTVEENDLRSAHFVPWRNFPSGSPATCGGCGGTRFMYKMVCLACRAKGVQDVVSDISLSSGRFINASNPAAPVNYQISSYGGSVGRQPKGDSVG